VGGVVVLAAITPSLAYEVSTNPRRADFCRGLHVLEIADRSVIGSAINLLRQCDRKRQESPIETISNSLTQLYRQMQWISLND
jgi:hypothetical protein